MQTAVFYESKGIYLNYEYFQLHKKTFITEIKYKLHPDIDAFVNQMLKDSVAFYSKSFSGNELKDWIEYQKKDNQFVDPKLNESESLHYYFYSIGSGALGLSTYNKPLSEEELNLLKRFRNVFELAYRRFIDIEQAIAQAKEAKIEAALERVRSRTMAMHNSDELREVVAELYQELEKLDFNIRQCVITILDKNTETVEWWSTGFQEKILPKSYIISYKDPKIYARLSVQSFIDAIDKKIPFRMTELSGENKRQFDQVLLEYTDLKNLPDTVKAGMMAINRLFISDAFMTHGVLEVVGTEPLPDEKVKTLQRFAVVFEQTYTRFLDLQKAEAQAREAQIQLALERIRARSMAMQKSDELAAISYELFKQVQSLGVATWHCSFNIYDEDQNSSTEWGSNAGGTYPTYKVPRVGIFQQYYDIGYTGKSLHIEVIGEDRCADHYKWLCTLPGVGEQLVKL